MATPKKSEFVSQLKNIALFMRILGENEFRVRAYEKGGKAVEHSSDSLEDIADGKVKLPGVGEGIKAAIHEFLGSGELKQRKSLMGRIPAPVIELVQVPGVGPKKAFLIHEELGVNSVGELEYACRENRLSSLKGFGEAVQKKILKGIELSKAYAGRYRLDDALNRVTFIEKEIRSVLAKKDSLTQVGGLGRNAEIIDRFEFLIVGPKLGPKKIEKLFSKSETTSEKVFKSEIIRMDGQMEEYKVTLWIAGSEPDSKLLQWLCSDEKVKKQIEKKDGFKSWENSWLESESLKRKPSNKTYRIREHGRVKGIFHNHTNFSDGANTLEEMAVAAEKLGYEYIGISDHSQSAFYAQGLKEDKIKEQQDLVKKVQKKVKIKIFHGVESNILADGKLDYSSKLLDSLDFVIGSIHSRFQMNEKQMTERLVTALSNPRLTMWGHPTGRLLLGRPGYDLDWKACFNAIEKNNVVVELNSNPHRLDIDWRWGAEIEKRGIQISINPDAHSKSGLKDTVFGEKMAEKAMIECTQILNLKSCKEVEKFLWERKQKC